MATFTPPKVYDNPAILPESRTIATRLFRYYKSRARYVAVFALSDGTFVQDTPTTENTNTNIPYPYNPWDPSSPYSTSYYIDFSQSPPQPAKSTVSASPYITKVYLEPGYVSPAEVTALTNAGYGALIS